MVEVERPKSMFGKLSYPHEQFILFGFMRDVERLGIAIDPFIIGQFFPVELISEERRLKSAKESIEKAKHKLKVIGV